MVMLAALREHGLSYVVDPKSSYKELSADKRAADYVQFPRQTLQFKAGDCDDLSAAYCALLEAVGVPTAFITVPGHIYAAFKLDQDGQEARQAFSTVEDLIVAKDGTVWVPIETTILKQGFLQAWAAGARQWREHQPAGRAGFHPTADAWGTYAPVAFGVGSFQLDSPPEAAVRATFAGEMERLVAREIRGREQQLLASLRQQEDPAARNRLGVLYARYGLEDEAREQLNLAIARRELAPALVNLGNLEYLKGRMNEAVAYYERAVRSDGQNATALIALPPRQPRAGELRGGPPLPRAGRGRRPAAGGAFRLPRPAGRGGAAGLRGGAARRSVGRMTMKAKLVLPTAAALALVGCPPAADPPAEIEALVTPPPPAGSLDASFGANGAVIIPVGPPGNSIDWCLGRCTPFPTAGFLWQGPAAAVTPCAD